MRPKVLANMNCQEAGESLSMLLDGALGLTERVPLEVHVDTCDACQRQLVHLQDLRELEQRARPTPRRLHWWPVLASGFVGKALAVMRAEDVTTRLRRLIHWRPVFAPGFVGKALGVMRAEDVTTRLRRLAHWRPVLAPGFVEKALGVMRVEDVTTRLRRLVHWRPVLAPGLVEKALGVMRAEDMTTRLRRLVTERVPSRQLAVAAAVPLLVMLAVFIFERGFTVGSAIRQRPAAAPSQATSDPPAMPPGASIAPSSPTMVKPIAPAPVPPPPSVATRATAAPPAVASQPVPPKPPLPVEKSRTAETKVAAARLAEPKAIDAKGTARAARSDEVVKDEKASPPVAAKPTPAKPAAAAATNGSSDSNRKVARAVPNAHAPIKVAQTTVPPSRRGMVDVAGRLQVKSRSDAERDLTALLASAGGTVVNRQRGASVTVLDAGIPHANYAKFAKGITRIGSWRVEAERTPLPDVVQVSVRLAE